MSNNYDKSEFSKKIGMLDSETLSILERVIESKRVNDGVKRRIIELIYSEGANVTGVCGKLIDEKFEELSDFSFNALWNTAIKFSNETTRLTKILDCKKLFDNFKNIKYGVVDSYALIISKLIEGPLSIRKMDAVLAHFNDDKNRDLVLSDAEKYRFLDFITTDPINIYKNAHDKLGYTNRWYNINNYAFFLDSRTLSVDDKLYNQFLEMCPVYYSDKFYVSSPDETDYYKIVVANEILLSSDLSESKYEIAMKYLHAILKDGVLGLKKMKNGKFPLALSELLNTSMIQIASGKSMPGVTDDEFIEALNRVKNSDNPLIEAYIMLELGNDNSKGSLAKSFYNRVIEAPVPVNGREQIKVYEFLIYIKDLPELEFRQCLELYSKNVKSILGSFKKSLWINNMEALMYILKRLNGLANDKKNDEAIDFLRVICLFERLIPLYSIGVIVNFVEFCLSVYETGGDEIYYTDEYCKQNGISISRKIEDFDTVDDYKQCGLDSLKFSLTSKMLELLNDEKVKDMTPIERDEYAYKILREMTNCELFCEYEDRVKRALSSQVNKTKKIGKINDLTNRCFTLINNK